jgi:Carboxypeptidase regulatory-like domain
MRVLSGIFALTLVSFPPSKAAGPVLSGTVTDNSGRAVEKVLVALESLDGKTRLTTTTDSSGSFHFDAAPDGSYSLSASEPAHPFAIYGPVTVNAGKTTRQDIVLEPPGTIQDAISCEFSWLKGMVRGLRKSPPATVLLCMTRVGQKSCTHLLPDGQIALGITPGNYKLTLEDSAQRVLISQTLDLSYCGEYRYSINLLEVP